MKILQLTRDFTLNGGIGVYVRSLKALLNVRSHQVAVICSEGPADGDASVWRVPRYDEFGHPGASVTREEVLSIAAEFDPDVVLIHAMDDYDLERLLRDRYAVARFVHNHVYCSSGIDHETASKAPCCRSQGVACALGFILQRCWHTRHPVTAATFYRRAASAVASLRSSSLVFAGSRYLRDRLVRNGVDWERVALAPYFPAVSGAAMVPLCSRAAGANLLFVGRIVPDKGLDYLLQALRDLPGDWRLVVNGDGPGLDRATALARRLRLDSRIEFAGWTGRERLLECYEAADIVVVPSVWPEPFGLVGIEAMAYGKPVVAFRSGAIPEWLAHGETGYLVDTGSVDGLRRRIGELLANPDLRHRMGGAAKERVLAEFSPDRHAAALLHGLEHIAGALPLRRSGCA